MPFGEVAIGPALEADTEQTSTKTITEESGVLTSLLCAHTDYTRNINHESTVNM